MTYRIIALSLFAIFYIIYLIKNIKALWGTGKPSLKEIAMRVACYCAAAAEIASIVNGDALLGYTGRGILLKVFGIYFCITAICILVLSMLSIGTEWNIKSKKAGKAGLITKGMYSFSRNPVILSFDLLYIGLLLMYFNVLCMLFTILAIATLHYRILTEEGRLEKLYGEEYLRYKKTVHRYLGHGRLTFSKVKCFIYVIAAIFSILYYFTCVAYAGFKLSFVWIWLLLFGFSIVRIVLLVDEIGHRENGSKLKFRIPVWFKVIYRILFVTVAALFIFVEVNVIVYMNMAPKENLDYVIVLGAGLKGDEPTRPLYLRIQKAYNYLKRNPDTIAIASGGQGRDEIVSEASVIATHIIRMGLEPSRVIMEDKSTDTIENIRYSFEKIPEGDVSVGLVTNGFHLYRAILIARSQGHYNVTGIPAQTLFPVGIHYVVREFFGVIQLTLGLG